MTIASAVGRENGRQHAFGLPPLLPPAIAGPVASAPEPRPAVATLHSVAFAWPGRERDSSPWIGAVVAVPFEPTLGRPRTSLGHRWRQSFD